MNLSKDVLTLLAMKLNFKSLLKFCQCNSKVFKHIFKNEEFWRNKLIKHFPKEYRHKDFQNENIRETYMYIHRLRSIRNVIDSECAIHIASVLSLEKRMLTKIPPLDLPNLRYLFLSHNALTKLPKFKLPKLENLYLDDNSLETLPELDLPNLRVLHLHNNKIQVVPELKLPKLVGFSIYDNLLSEEEQKRMEKKYKNIRLIL